MHEGKEWHLVDLINEKRKNSKYLPVEHEFPASVEATSCMETATKNADLIVWATPHSFVEPLIEDFKKFKGNVNPGCVAASLIKGGVWLDDQKDVQFISEKIIHETGMPCTVLMGANIAKDIARGAFAEGTIGYDVHAEEAAEIALNLFDGPDFSVETIANRRAVALCGSMKNIIALTAGFANGLGMGPNTAAAIMRTGMIEERRLIEKMAGGTPKILQQIVEARSVIERCFVGQARSWLARGVLASQSIHLARSAVTMD